MSAAASPAVWWSPDGRAGYLGRSATDGLDYQRHGWMCRPGLWSVSITGWHVNAAFAVMDDFGNLVQVPAGRLQ